MKDEDFTNNNPNLDISSTNINHKYTSPKMSEEQTKKLLTLQDELLKSKKQMGNRQLQWEKEKSHLLNKQEIFNMEIIELKQRIANLSQVNKTLADALGGNIGVETLVDEIKLLSAKMIGDSEVLSKMETRIKIKKKSQAQPNQSNRKQGEKWKEKIKESEERINYFKGKYEYSQEILKRKENEILKKDEMIRQFQIDLQRKENELQKLQKQFNLIKQMKIQYEKKSFDEQPSSSFEKSIQQIQNPLKNKIKNQKNPKELSLSEVEDCQFFPKKYTQKDSSYLMVKPTSDQNLHFQTSQNASSYINNISELNSSEYPEARYEDEDEYEEEQKLLCEVCSRVFTFEEFQKHMKKCGQKQYSKDLKFLLQKRRAIEDELQTIRLRQEEEEKYEKQNRMRSRKSSSSKSNTTYYIVESKGNGKDSAEMQSQIKQIVEIMKKNESHKRQKPRRIQLNSSNEYANFSICNKKNYF